MVYHSQQTEYTRGLIQLNLFSTLLLQKLIHVNISNHWPLLFKDNFQ